METVNLIFNAENIRMLVILAFGFCGYMVIKSQMKDMKYSLLKAMDEKLNAFHVQLKVNDFAHLNNTIEALLLRLKRMGSLRGKIRNI